LLLQPPTLADVKTLVAATETMQLIHCQTTVEKDIEEAQHKLNAHA
jgi:hypothetical protein